MKKLTSAQWLEMVEAKETEIENALRTIYKKAIGISGGFKVTHTAILTEEGKIEFGTETGSCIDGDVYAGIAIYLGKIEDFDPTDDLDVEELLEQELSDEELQLYRTWLEENPLENIQSLDSLETYDKDIHGKVYDSLCDGIAEVYGESWVEAKYNGLINNLKYDIECQEIQSSY